MEVLKRCASGLLTLEAAGKLLGISSNRVGIHLRHLRMPKVSATAVRVGGYESRLLPFFQAYREGKLTYEEVRKLAGVPMEWVQSVFEKHRVYCPGRQQGWVRKSQHFS